MGTIPANVETNKQPPMTVPLRHFVIGLGFLLLGGVVGTLVLVDVLPGQPTLTHVHLSLVGWVCVTIMGAMTQFVPVWSGASLYSERLSTVQLWLLVAGLIGFGTSLLLGQYGWFPLFGGTMLTGFWVFVYNIARTLGGVRPWDVTERHFAMALGFFVLVTFLGVVLAVSYTHPLYANTPFTQGSLRMSHATLAVFGAVLITVLGALYQLGTMFTQSDLHGIDHSLRRVEEVGYPLGVVVLATGRLFEHTFVGRVGSLLVVAGLFSFSIILARRLYETSVDWTPMLRRYAIVAGAMAIWSVLAFLKWIQDPISPRTLFGSPELVHLLFLGVIGFVVLGTLYHIVPFIIWVHRYSDLLGLEDVPMIDDLYSDRLAAIDFVLVLLGSGVLVASEWVSLPWFVTVTGGVLVVSGFLIFITSMLLVIREHSPHSIVEIVVPKIVEKPEEESINRHQNTQK
ncbi:hypothetical protein [Haloferax denitrificans]|nr:hypothetical protein [Haloferax denitrificans]